MDRRAFVGTLAGSVLAAPAGYRGALGPQALGSEVS
jgi:hypothetical protein